MRGKNRKSIAREKLPQFTTMYVIDGQDGLVFYSSLIFYSLTIDNILNIIVLLILAGVSLNVLTGDNGIITKAQEASLRTKFSKYMEEFEMNKINAMISEVAALASGDNRLAILATSSYLKEYIATEKFVLPNYIAPVDAGTIKLENGLYYAGDWAIDVHTNSGTLLFGTIVGYQGSSTSLVTISIPDSFSGKINNEEKIIKIDSIKGDGTYNIFNKNNSKVKNNLSVQKVIVAKGIKSITQKGLAYLGNNVQLHIMYVGTDLVLGNDISDANVIGYEGIENDCGSFTFVAPETRSYKFKLWGASGGDGNPSYSTTRGSSCGLDGYSEGQVSLNAGECIYCFIGGKGL